MQQRTLRCFSFLLYMGVAVGAVWLSVRFILPWGAPFLLAFGMNDGSRPPEETAANCEAVARRVLALRPDAAVLLVSTMLPNPDASNGWFASHPLQEPALLRLAASLREEGAACDVARVTSASEAVLRKKRFLDYTGNNINHPNDFFSRVYAQTLLETLVGYDGEAFAARASV